jgi:DNA gyrase subunit A
MLISQSGVLIRTTASQISVIGRNTQGVRVMKIEESDKVMSVATIVAEE